MKATLVFVGLFLVAAALAQQQDESGPNGAIHGTVMGQDGKPAKGIGLEAWPLGVALATRLPQTRTNDVGEYRFDKVPWWGKYRVRAEDEDAGYSVFSTGEGRNKPPEVELTPEHPEAEMKVWLPPKAGFLHIRLTNRRTGARISGMQVALAPMESPEQQLFSISCYSNRVVLIPPDKNLLLHVTSDGYREWDESTGRGKPLHLGSGARITLDIQLDPLD
jgi:hypothetical protein